MDIKGKKIAILATNGFEQAELEVPRDRLKQAGATVDVISLAAGQISPWIRRHRRIGQWQGRVVGTIYIALGIRLAFQER